VKILVCSDSHGDTKVLEDIFFKHQDCNLYFHCGDSCLPEYLTSKFISVKGNCDYFDYQKVREVQTKWGTIHVEHGNAHMFDREEYIKSLNCFIFLFGHTHVKGHWIYGKTHVFNPGSLTRPRDGDKGSYLIVDIDDDTGKLTYKFYSVDL